MPLTLISIATVLLGIKVAARSIPSNVQTLYNAIVSQGTCSNKLATGFYSLENGGASFCYCGDHLSEGFMYIQGNSGQLADMDVDCDGAQGGAQSDHRCDGSTDTQSQTSFKSTIQGYNVGINDLDAFYHPYVVFGNDGSKPGWATFDPQSVGINPLSVMAVVCGNNMFYGIWGDENGDDGTHPMVGEASISLATLCFGNGISGDNGHDVNDVLYIAFTGADAVPGRNGASWAAQNPNTFENSISSLGDTLIQRIGGGNNGGGGGTCSWLGHCEGASCSTNDDCSDDLTCNSGVCGPSSGGGGSVIPPCTWPGHCIGASCSNNGQCDGDLTCVQGTCGGCTWAGHCVGASCSSDDDCGDNLTCQSGQCYYS